MFLLLSPPSVGRKVNVISDLFLFLHSGRFQAPRLRGEPCRKMFRQFLFCQIVITFYSLTLLCSDKFSVKVQISWQKEKKRPVVFTLFNGQGAYIIRQFNFHNRKAMKTSFTLSLASKSLAFSMMRMKLQFHFSFTTISKYLNQYHQCHHFVTC